MNRFMRRLVVPSLALTSLMLAANPADAGIVILKNGSVILGRIDPEDVTDDSVTLRRPTLERGGTPTRAIAVFLKRDIRWFDEKLDEPSRDYCDRFWDQPIDSRWRAFVEENRTKPGPTLPELPKFPKTPWERGLAPTPFTKRWGSSEIVLRRPVGWLPRETGEILMFESDAPGANGFTPRVHVFSVEAKHSPHERLRMIRDELAKVGTRELGVPTPKVVRGGWDAEWETTTARGKQTIRALRRAHFREHRTYFVTAYAHEDDSSGLAFLLRDCLATVQVRETPDERSAPILRVGQTFRFQTERGVEAWRTDAVEPSLTRFTCGEGDRRRVIEAPSVTPRQRLDAIAGAPTSPTLSGHETLEVSGTSFACEIHDALANGKRYRIWLARGLPFELRVEVEGKVRLELVAIDP